MARGNDEAHNPRRRPQRPQTDEEKMAIVKQVFPDAHEVITPHSPQDVETEEDKEQREMQESLGALADKYSVYQNYPEDDYNDDWRDLPDRGPWEDPDYRYDPNKEPDPEF